MFVWPPTCYRGTSAHFVDDKSKHTCTVSLWGRDTGKRQHTLCTHEHTHFEHATKSTTWETRWVVRWFLWSVRIFLASNSWCGVSMYMRSPIVCSWHCRLRLEVMVERVVENQFTAWFVCCFYRKQFSPMLGCDGVKTRAQDNRCSRTSRSALRKDIYVYIYI